MKMDDNRDVYPKSGNYRKGLGAGTFINDTRDIIKVCIDEEAIGELRNLALVRLDN